MKISILDGDEQAEEILTGDVSELECLWSFSSIRARQALRKSWLER